MASDAPPPESSPTVREEELKCGDNVGMDYSDNMSKKEQQHEANTKVPCVRPTQYLFSLCFHMANRNVADFPNELTSTRISIRSNGSITQATEKSNTLLIRNGRITFMAGYGTPAQPPVICEAASKLPASYHPTRSTCSSLQYAINKENILPVDSLPSRSLIFGHPPRVDLENRDVPTEGLPTSEETRSRQLLNTSTDYRVR